MSQDDRQTEHDSEVRRNVLVLATSMAMSWAVVQLVAALAAVTLKQLIDQPSLAGFAPGTFLASWAAGSVAIGRFMDGRGRAPGLRLAFALGVLGALLTFAGARSERTDLFLGGLALLGACCGGVNLARAGAADMYPPETRARGVSYVLVGAAAGAILSPLVYAPILSGAGSGGIVSGPWLAAGALLALGAIATLRIRVDPMRLAASAASTVTPSPGAGAVEGRRPLGQVLREPGVWPAFYAAVIAQAVMASFMTIIGVSMVEHGHALLEVTVTMSAHFIGMFGLVLVVGRVVERIGRQRAMVCGLVILMSGLLGLAVSAGTYVVMPSMFVIGLGWNLAFVASTVVLADAARPSERAGLLGFNDFAAVGLAAPGVVFSAILLGEAGLTTLVLVGAAIALTPLPVFLVRPRASNPPARA